MIIEQALLLVLLITLYSVNAVASSGTSSQAVIESVPPIPLPSTPPPNTVHTIPSSVYLTSLTPKYATKNTYTIYSSNSGKGESKSNLKESRVCLRMIANMTLIFDCITANGKTSILLPFGPSAAVNPNASSCQLSTCSDSIIAVMVIEYLGLTVTFIFDKIDDHKYWDFNSTTVNYTITDQLFPHLKSQYYNTKVSVRSQDSLFDWTVNKLPLLSSYHCEANTTLNHFGGSVMDDLIQVSLSVSQLQVQAFRFNDDIKFDDSKNCYADRRIIVPVTVAVALVLLSCAVIVVSICKHFYRKHLKQKHTPLSVNFNYDSD